MKANSMWDSSISDLYGTNLHLDCLIYLQKKKKKNDIRIRSFQNLAELYTLKVRKDTIKAWR